MKKVYNAVLIFGICIIISISSFSVFYEDEQEIDDRIYFWAYPVEAGIVYNLTDISISIEENNSKLKGE